MLDRKTLVFAIAIAAFALPFASAHEVGVFKLDAYNSGDHVYPVMFGAGLLIAAVSVVCIIFEKKFKEQHKKIAFLAIAGLTIGATAYLVWEISVIMLTSETQGPVHWHADIEISICGKDYKLKEAEGWTTRVGPLLLHHHGDMRIHVEGVVRKLSDVRIGNFFKAIGGNFEADTLSFAAQDGTEFHVDNGDLCPGGKSGTLKMLVNGKPEPAMADYVLSPYTDVPPGDTISIVFGAD